jgi:hypothetical protein
MARAYSPAVAWIDGQMRGRDDRTDVQGRMQTRGATEVERAKADGRWP